MGTQINPTQKKGNYFRKPTIKYNNNGTATITYYNGKEWVKTVTRDVNVANVFVGMHNTLSQKDSNGIITKAQAMKILQDVFELGTSVKYHDCGYGAASGGHLSEIKDLFELYMDKDMDGGEDITQKEQFRIMRTLDNW